MPENHRNRIAQEQTVKRTRRWARRLLALARTNPVGEPSESTLETFFAGVRWSEDLQPDGERTLRRASL